MRALVLEQFDGPFIAKASHAGTPTTREGAAEPVGSNRRMPCHSR